MTVRATSDPGAPSDSGAAAEALAARHLQAAGLRIIERNYRVRGGEVDLVAKDGESLVFVEVRLRREGRSGGRFGGALASVDMHKQRRLITAAECYLARFARTPPARFDVVLLDKIAAGHIEWLKDAFSR